MAKKEHNKAQEYLKQARKLTVRIFSLLEEKAQYEALREKITSSWGTERVSGGEKRDVLNEATNMIMETEQKILEQVAVLTKQKSEIRAVIEKVDDADQEDILYKVYFQFETLERAAVELGCCYRNACYIHGDALQAITEILDEQK